MRACGYCGDRVRWSRERSAYVHTSNGNRVSVGGPGDFVSAAHNRRGTPIGACDVVDLANVRGYMILAARECPNDYAEPLRIKATRGTWILRTAPTRRRCAVRSDRHHSSDLLTVHHGHASPTYICGYHESRDMLTEASANQRATVA